MLREGDHRVQGRFRREGGERPSWERQLESAGFSVGSRREAPYGLRGKRGLQDGSPALL